MGLTINCNTQAYMVNPETVVLKTAAGSTLATLTTATRHAISLREAAASNGIYLADDIVWTWSTSQYATAASPGQTITSGTTVYTVLDSSYSVMMGFGKATCRDLVMANGLTDSVNYQHPTITLGTATGRSVAWANLRTGISARVQPDTTGDYNERGVRAAVTRYNVIFDPATGAGSTFAITNTGGDWGRFIFGSLTLDVIEYRNASRIDELPVALCEVSP